MSPSNTHNSETWKAYWKEQGQPWRTEPAIDEERQQRLLSYYQGVADIERGMYPFKGSPYYRYHWRIVLSDRRVRKGIAKIEAYQRKTFIYSC